MVLMNINGILKEDVQENFARGRISSATELKQRTLAKTILKAKEETLFMDRFCEDFPIEGTSQGIPKEVGGGTIASEVPEWGDVPIVRSRMSKITVDLTKNATRMEVSAEAKMDDPTGVLLKRNINARGMEMAQKFDKDALIVLESAVRQAIPADTPNAIKISDIVDGCSILEGADYTPTVIIMSPSTKAKLTNHIAYDKLETTGRTVEKGLYPTLNGIPVLVTNKITPSIVIILDERVKPLLKVFNGTMGIEDYKIPYKGTNYEGKVFDEYVKPVNIDSERIVKITNA